MAKKGTTGFTNQQQTALYWARRRRLEVLKGSGPPPSGPPVNTALPTVSATPFVGVPISGFYGTWTGAQPITLTVKWQANSVDVAGATSITYTPVGGDVGKTLRIVVSATNSAGGPIVANSAQTVAVSAAPTAPVFTVAAAVTPTSVFVGTVVTCDGGTVTGNPTPTKTYQWQSLGGSWANIGGATSATYTAAIGDLAKALRCIVTATNTAGNATSTSNQTGQVLDAPVLVAPVLTWITASTDTTPDFTADLTNPLVGDVITLQWASDSGFTTIVGTSPNTVDATEQGALQVSFTTGTLTNGTYYFRSWHSRGGFDSAFSNVVTVTIAAPFQYLDLFTGVNAGTTGFWVDSKDLTQQFQTIAGTGAVAVNGDRVGHIKDKSGNVNTKLAVADNTSRPTFVTGGGWQFSVAENRQIGGVLTANITGSAIYCALVMVPSASGEDYHRVVSCSVNSATADFNNISGVALYNRNAALSQYTTTRNSINGGQAPFVNGTRVLIESMYDGTNQTFWVNGVAQTPVAATGAFNIGFVNFGQDRMTGAVFGGIINEVILLGRVPTTTERTNIRAKAIADWGIV